MRLIACFCLLSVRALSAQDLPRVDLHVHIHEGSNPANSMSPAQAVALSEKMSVRFGILGEGGCRGEIHDYAALKAFIDSTVGLPVYRGMQVYGFDWARCLGADNLRRLDYLAADALIFPDRGGKDVRLWLPEAKFDDAQDFMERYIEYTVKVLSQPIQIWANPTFLPEALESQYDLLWTKERMQRVIAAAVRNGIAIEINSRYHIPSAAFIRLAKASGAKFSFGSNQHVHGIGEIGWSIKIARECGLVRSDIFLPARKLK
jgi:hypothetical protein